MGSYYQTQNARLGETWDSTVNGWKAYSFDPGIISGSTTTLTSGSVYMTRVPTPVSFDCTKIALYVSTAGSTLTAAQNVMALHDSTGAKLQTTADQSAVWNTAGYYEMAITSTAIAGGPDNYVYVSIMSNGTTPVTIYRTGGQSRDLYNANLASGSFRACMGGTGQTSIPASPAMTSSVGTAIFWCGLKAS